MRKPSALLAWKMLVLALPKGIGALVIVVVGLAAGLPLTIVLIGVPLLAGMLSLARKMMVDEARLAEGWLQGKEYPALPEETAAPSQQGWKTWVLSVLKDRRSYRAIGFGFLELPIGILAFTMAIVLPVVAFSVLLSPLAYEVSMRWFEFNLFPDSWGLNQLGDWSLTSAHRSWIAGGVGVILTLLLPLMLRGLGRWYAAWVRAIAGPEPVREATPEEAYTSPFSPFEMDSIEAGPFPATRT
ncbi:sensor domain-containing protein [Paenibacillus sp. 598K]|uniref:sensor domain-containing protein n=1 Tax=Paenibacillus sp. 598K TaxID=1117987 RepID=UPI000FFEBEE2|nr:sensor domain-containing protein [Paenibacillus sp. 598K]